MDYMQPLTYCDVCGVWVPPDRDGLCGRSACVNVRMAEEREELAGAEADEPYDVGGEG